MVIKQTKKTKYEIELKEKTRSEQNLPRQQSNRKFKPDILVTIKRTSGCNLDSNNNLLLTLMAIKRLK